MQLRGCPPSVVNQPPSRIFPSACTARELTQGDSPSGRLHPAPGLKLLSRLPSALSRAMFVRVCPPSVVKLPPTRILPSACTAREQTPALAPGLKLVSRLPSALSRPMFVRVCPPSVLKPPPTRIFPSACTARELTPPLAPGLKSSGNGVCAWAGCPRHSPAARHTTGPYRTPRSLGTWPLLKLDVTTVLWIACFMLVAFIHGGFLVIIRLRLHGENGLPATAPNGRGRNGRGKPLCEGR